MGRLAGVCVGVLMLLCGAAEARAASLGDLGFEACLTPDSGPQECARGGDELFEATEAGRGDLAISPDGRHVYFSARQGIGLLRRDAKARTLVPVGCTGPCTGGVGSESVGVRVSADGTTVAAVSRDAVATFDRNPVSGELTLRACVEFPGGRPWNCQVNRALVPNITDLEISPSGGAVYVASNESRLVQAIRQTGPGTMAPVGQAGVADGPRAMALSGELFVLTNEGLRSFVDTGSTLAPEPCLSKTGFAGCHTADVNQGAQAMGLVATADGCARVEQRCADHGAARAARCRLPVGVRRRSRQGPAAPTSRACRLATRVASADGRTLYGLNIDQQSGTTQDLVWLRRRPMRAISDGGCAGVSVGCISYPAPFAMLRSRTIHGRCPAVRPDPAECRAGPRRPGVGPLRALCRRCARTAQRSRPPQFRRRSTHRALPLRSSVDRRRDRYRAC